EDLDIGLRRHLGGVGVEYGAGKRQAAIALGARAIGDDLGRAAGAGDEVVALRGDQPDQRAADCAEAREPYLERSNGHRGLGGWAGLATPALGDAELLLLALFARGVAGVALQLLFEFDAVEFGALGRLGFLAGDLFEP